MANIKECSAKAAESDMAAQAASQNSGIILPLKLSRGKWSGVTACLCLSAERIAVCLRQRRVLRRVAACAV